MNNNINIGKLRINLDSKPFVIAEIGINHNGDISLGKEIIQAAYENGADAVKFQTYITEKGFQIKNLNLSSILKTWNYLLIKKRYFGTMLRNLKKFFPHLLIKQV